MLRAEHAQRASVRPLALAVVLLAGLVVATPNTEAEEAKGSRVDPRASLRESARTFQASSGDAAFLNDGGRHGFYSRLIPQMNRRLGQIGPVDLVTIPGQSINDHIFYERLHRSTQRNLEKATLQAMEGYLLEETSLRGVVSRIEQKFGGGKKEKAGARRRAGTTRFDVRFSSGLPVLEVGHRLNAANLNFRLHATGRTTIEFHRSTFDRAKVVADLNPVDGDYQINCLFDF